MNENVSYYSSDELVDLVRKLSEADKKRLLACAHRLAEICWCDNHEELLHEAILRIIDGRRKKCLKGIPFVIFMYGVMKSIASEWRQKAYREICCLDENNSSLNEKNDNENAAEQAIKQKQIINFSNMLFDEVSYMLSDDQNAIFVIKSDMNRELTANEIQEKLGIDKKKYNAIRKKIRRSFNTLKLKHQGKYNDVI